MIDPTGTNIQLACVVEDGVIFAVFINSGGQNVTDPKITAVDPTGSGSGAVISAIVINPVTMTLSAGGTASSANIGNVVRVNNGMGIVIGVPNSTTITVNVINELTNVWPAISGTWSMTAPVQTITGLDHLDGETVSILADGNVNAPQVVVNGSVTLDQPATDVTIGLPFTCQLQSLYIDAQGGSTIQSKRKKINAVTVRMQDSRGLKAGSTFNTLVEIKERSNQPMGQPIQLFTGDQRVNIDPNWTVQGQVCIQQDYPLPATILALIPEIEVGDS